MVTTTCEIIKYNNKKTNHALTPCHPLQIPKHAHIGNFQTTKAKYIYVILNSPFPFMIKKKNKIEFDKTFENKKL